MRRLSNIGEYRTNGTAWRKKLIIFHSSPFAYAIVWQLYHFQTLPPCET
ncbi:Uncharacterised protein [Vibrio cholerae]|nr:Uncharacterised protein [Vibrio cholerae]